MAQMQNTQENLTTTLNMAVPSVDAVATMGPAGRGNGCTIFGKGTVEGLEDKVVVVFDQRLAGEDLIEPMTVAIATLKAGTQKSNGLVTLGRGKPGQAAMEWARGVMSPFVTETYDYHTDVVNCGWRSTQKKPKKPAVKKNKYEISVNGVVFQIPLEARKVDENGDPQFDVEENLESLVNAETRRDENAQIDAELDAARKAGMDAVDQGVSVLNVVAA